MSFVTQGSIPEVVEKVSGSSLDDRTSILDSIQDLGPPDMIHLKKHNSTSNTKHPDIGTYFYYTGADVSSSASIAALLNSISNIIGESPQLWFGKNKPWKVREATYCTYNAFSKMDIRVTVNFPGGVEYIIIDCDGNQVMEKEQYWIETYVSSVVRSLITADGDTSADFMSIVEIRKINPFLSVDQARLFFHGFESLFFDGIKLGCNEELQVPTVSNNYLIDAFKIAVKLTGLYNDAIELLKRIREVEPSVTYLIAELYLLHDEEIKSIEIIHDGIIQDPLDGQLLMVQAQYCLDKKRLDLALPIAIRAVNASPSDFKPWALLVEVYISLGKFEEALLTLNSCPMVTHKDKYHLKRINNPQHEDLHLPLPVDVTLDQVSTLNSMDVAVEHQQIDQSLLNLPAANLKSTFAHAYKLLTEIVHKTGWETLLKYRTKVFVMEEEFRKDNHSSYKNASVNPNSNLSLDKFKETSTNGEATNGDATNGEATNGDAKNGNATNSDAVNGSSENSSTIVNSATEDAKPEDGPIEVPPPPAKIPELAAHSNEQRPQQSSVKEISKTEEASSLKSKLSPDFKKKRLCERWLDNLFMLLYEDLRIYTMYRAEIMHFEAQQLDIKKTTLEWELLGLVAHRLGHKREAAQTFRKALTGRFAVRSSKKLLEFYIQEKVRLRKIELDNKHHPSMSPEEAGKESEKLNDLVTELIVKLTVWNHRWYCGFSPFLIESLAAIVEETGRVKVESEIKAFFDGNGNGVFTLMEDSLGFLETFKLIESDKLKR
ncbi:hypothetical protein B5S30_g2330 [[Candida] boidinii]|nr:hypothetical protein B5S30_g2330 [[Candida] boidinii]